MLEIVSVILLGAIVAGQFLVLAALHSLRADVARWYEIWARLDDPASNYHAKEIWKTVQEIAHMMAVDRMERKQ